MKPSPVPRHNPLPALVHAGERRNGAGREEKRQADDKKERKVKGYLLDWGSAVWLGGLAGLCLVLVLVAYAWRRRTLARRKAMDPLTGLMARGAFWAGLESACARARRRDVPLSVLFADIDHLEAINGFYGTEAGDSVLRHFAGALRKLAGEGAMASRVAADEFALLMPGASQAAARNLAQRLAATVRATPCPLQPDPVAYTVSVGAVAFEPGDTADELMRRADRALNAAKLAGRDTVVSRVMAEAVDGPARVRRQSRDGLAAASPDSDASGVQ